ncbi:MAG: hypothetical protein FWG94_13100 [Oscillospiraceae bacterium]|nr:hypothetical protein [Oscillospiraceae bacterium]
MIGQSFAIIILILVMSLMFLRSGKRTGAVFALPLISVPLFHLLAYAVYRPLMGGVISIVGFHVAMDAAGLWCGILSSLILSRAIGLKKLRYTYFAGCTAFSSALAAAYIFMYHL